MAHTKRKKRLRLNSAEQLQLLTSATALEVIQYFRQCGPSTVAEAARGIGKKPKSLHYHVRKLLAAGFVHEVSQRRSGARTEAILDVTADRFIGGNIQSDQSLKELTCDAANTVIQLAKREFAKAVSQEDSLVDSGTNRNIAADRMVARLSASQLAQVNQHLRAISELFSNNVGSENGQLCALTFVLTPVNDAQKEE